jgi:hypothetical protein
MTSSTWRPHRSLLPLPLLLLATLLLVLLVLLSPSLASAYKFHLPPTHFDPSAPPKVANPPDPEVVRRRNEERFPGEFVPEGQSDGKGDSPEMLAESRRLRESVGWLMRCLLMILI